MMASTPQEKSTAMKLDGSGGDDGKHATGEEQHVEAAHGEHATGEEQHVEAAHGDEPQR